VRLRKIHPIDLSREYPCPCRRKGKLSNIVLTEALGCELCQNIFVLSPQGESIEQLNAHYPYKKSWYWTGRKWLITKKPWPDNYLIIATMCVVLLSLYLLISTPLLISLKGGINLFSVMIVGLIVILLSVFLWLAHPH
jgi:hypothetical protein